MKMKIIMQVNTDPVTKAFWELLKGIIGKTINIAYSIIGSNLAEAR